MNIKKLAALARVPFMMLLMAAGDPQGFVVWTAGDLKARAAAFASKLSPEGVVASDKIADYGYYNTQLAHREATGVAELHEKFTDIFMIQSGEATVVIGGKSMAATRPARAKSAALPSTAANAIAWQRAT